MTPKPTPEMPEIIHAWPTVAGKQVSGWDEIKRYDDQVQYIRADLSRPHAADTAVGGESEEWFFRWIARGKGGHTPMQNAIDTIWHHPNNPYAKENPWQDKAAPRGDE